MRFSSIASVGALVVAVVALGVAMGSDFFVVSGRGMEAAWAQHIEADPNVRLRVGDDVYELRAVRVEATADRDLFLAALSKKYEEFDASEEQPSEATLYRLEAR